MLRGIGIRYDELYTRSDHLLQVHTANVIMNTCGGDFYEN
jgi:hypothetical protein